MYFSGFSLTSESELFEEYMIRNDVTASAFSYGCIPLVENIINGTYDNKYFKKRLDKIQLFSPAFFNDKDEKYRRLQLMFFKKNPQQYCDIFLKNSGFVKEQIDKYYTMGTYEQLKELLEYNWELEKIQQIIDMGIQIEIYLGENDKIINSQKTLEFFTKLDIEVYFIKNVGHILK